MYIYIYIYTSTWCKESFPTSNSPQHVCQMWLSWLPIKLWYRGSCTSAGVSFGFSTFQLFVIPFHLGKIMVRNLDSFPPKRVNTNPIHHTFGGMMSPSNSPIYIYIYFVSPKKRIASKSYDLFFLSCKVFTFCTKIPTKASRSAGFWDHLPGTQYLTKVNQGWTRWRLDWCLGLLWISRWEPTLHSGWILWII